MTDHDTFDPDPLIGWDDELNARTDANRHRPGDSCGWTDAETEARLEAAGECIRPPAPGADQCNQGYDHTGRCDWFGPTYDRIVADAVAKAAS